MAAAVALMVLLGFGHGTLNAVDRQRTSSPGATSSRCWRGRLFMLSGVFFVPDRMPPQIIAYLAWNPVLHGVELMRYGYYPDYRSPTLECRVSVLLGAGVDRARAGRRARHARARRPRGEVAGSMISFQASTRSTRARGHRESDPRERHARSARPQHRRARRQRRRQVDTAAPDRRHRAAEPRPDPARRAASRGRSVSPPASMAR